MGGRARARGRMQGARGSHTSTVVGGDAVQVWKADRQADALPLPWGTAETFWAPLGVPFCRACWIWLACSRLMMSTMRSLPN